MATKTIKLQYNESGITAYARILQETSGNWYDPADGTFKAYAAGNVVALAEDANVKRLYAWSGGTAAAWPDGRYYVFMYKQAGGSPNPNTDTAIGSGMMQVEGDAEISITNDKTGYSISGTKQTLDALNDITAASVWAVATRTLSSFGTLIADIWGYVTRILTAAVNINSNTDITAIKAKTDLIPFPIKKNVNFPGFMFFLALSSDHITGATGKTVTAQRSLGGAAFASCANSVIEIANGCYKIDLAAADLNNAAILLKFTATDCDARIIFIATTP